MNSLNETVPSRLVSDIRSVLMIEDPALVKEFLTRMKRWLNLATSSATIFFSRSSLSAAAAFSSAIYNCSSFRRCFSASAAALAFSFSAALGSEAVGFLGLI